MMDEIDKVLGSAHGQQLPSRTQETARRATTTVLSKIWVIFHFLAVHIHFERRHTLEIEGS